MIGLLANPRFEIIPAPSVLDAVQVLPPGTVVTVTCHSDRGLDATIATAVQLAAHGFRAVPHIAARLVRDAAHLGSVIEQLDHAGVAEVFAVGGDVKRPVGVYGTSFELLRELVRRWPGRLRVGIPGYPEGHPEIDDETLMADLLRKRELAQAVVTQLCFDPEGVLRWLRRIRADGLDLPVFIGVPGAVSRAKLVRVAGSVGVGPSIRFLRKHRGAARLLTRPGSAVAEELLTAFPPESARALGVAGVHLYTFNEVEETERWRRRQPVLTGRPAATGH